MTRENINAEEGGVGWSFHPYLAGRLNTEHKQLWTFQKQKYSLSPSLQLLQHLIQLLLQICNLLQYRRLSRLCTNKCPTQAVPWINSPKKKSDEQHPKKGPYLSSRKHSDQFLKRYLWDLEPSTIRIIYRRIPILCRIFSIVIAAAKPTFDPSVLVFVVRGRFIQSNDCEWN